MNFVDPLGLNAFLQAAKQLSSSPAALGGIALGIVGLIDEATGGVISDYAVQRLDEIKTDIEMGIRIAGKIIEVASDVFLKKEQGPKSPLDVPGDRRPPEQRPNAFGKSNKPPIELDPTDFGGPRFPKGTGPGIAVAVGIAASTTAYYSTQFEDTGAPKGPIVPEMEFQNKPYGEPEFRRADDMYFSDDGTQRKKNY